MRARILLVVAGLLLVPGALAVAPAAAAPAGQLPGTFVAIPSVTVLDSAKGIGSSGPLRMHSTTLVPVAGLGGIPATGSPTLSMIVTVSGAHAPGFLTVWPAGAPRPQAATVAARPGAVDTVSAYVPVGTGGAIAVANPVATPLQMTIRVLGYYLDGAATTPGSFVPLPATTLFDETLRCRSRLVYYCKTTPVAIAGHSGIPAGVHTVVMDVRVTSRGGGDLDFLSSTFVVVNPGPGQVDFARVDLDPDGGVTLKPFSDSAPDADTHVPEAVQVALYAVGYYQPGVPVAAGAFHEGGATFGFFDLAAQESVAKSPAEILPLPAGVSEVVIDVGLYGNDPEFPSTSAPGGLAIYPAGGPRPASAQTAFAADASASTQFDAAIGAHGRRIIVHNASAGTVTELIVSVQGYYLPAS